MKAKTVAPALAAVLCCASLCGCWDYRGVDELTIVAGMAIDHSETQKGKYALTFEIVDSQASDNGKMKSMLLESEGNTVFEAVHNAGKKLHNNMYFGNTELLIVSHQLAQQEGLSHIVDAFLRDFSTRDNLSIVVSKEKTAKEIITPEKDSAVISSYEINKNIGGDERTTNSTRTQELYTIYNNLTQGVSSLTLPALSMSKRPDGMAQPLSDGMAIFKGDKQVSYLLDEALPSYLFIMEELRGGTYSFFLEQGEGVPKGVTVILNHSEAKKNVSYDGSTMTFGVDVKVWCSTIDVLPELEMSNEVVTQLEQRAGQALKADIEHLIRGIQKGSGMDIFGFGLELYSKNPALWEQVKEDWEALFRNAKLEIQCIFQIHDTGIIKSNKE